MNIEKRTIAWKGLTLRSADDEGTTSVEGVAVPFGDIIDTWDGAETFDRECEFQGLDEAKLCFEHGETIGRITKAESTDDGLHITARISDTARGRDAMTLIRDGVLDSFSVGFIPIESQKDRDGITHRRKVRLLETSIVSWPAYQNAKMTKSAAPAVQQRKETMENNNELMDLIQSMQEEQRGIKAEISKMGAKPAPAAIGAAYRSHGEYMQALARGDEQAMTVMKECRELISTKDTGNTATWIADDLKLIEDRRKVSQLLTHDTLPATGMSMEYHVVTSDTTAVGKQETEGSELSFGKVAFGTKTADINTYGGYTTLSRQTIERSTTPMLNTALTALQTAAQSVGGGLQSLWTGIMAVVDAMTGGQPAGVAFGNMLNTVATAAQTVGGWLKTAGNWISQNLDLVTPLVAAVGGAVAVVTAVTTAMQLAAAAQALLNAVMAANPIMLVITLIAALVAGLTYFFACTNTGKAVWSSFTGFLGSCVQGIIGFFSGLGSTIVNIFNSAANGARNAWNGVVSWFRGLPGSIVGFFGNAGSILYNAGASIISGFLNGLKSMWSNVTGWISGIGDWIKAHKGPISYDRRLLIPAGQAIMTGFAQGLNTGFDSNVETAISRANRRLAAMPLNLSAQGNTATPAVVNTWNVEINGEVIDKDGTAKAIKRLLADYDARRS